MHRLAVEIDGDVLAESQHRQCFRRGTFCQAHPHLVPCQDHHPHAAEVFIAAGVVAVDVGVDKEADLAVTEGAYGGHDLVRQGCELVVDHDHAIFPDGQADVATGAFQVIDTALYRVGHHLHLAEILLGQQGRRNKQGQGQQ